MGDVKSVIRALIANRKAGDPAVLADGGEAIAPSSQNLVSVRLVSHVPDDFVLRRVERVMEGEGQLHRA